MSGAKESARGMERNKKEELIEQTMVLSSVRHALIACHYLVEAYYEKRFVPAPEIAERYNMNVRALMPALRQLTREGVLRSRVGGLTRGFMLNADPENISMERLFTVLQGERRFECCRDVMDGVRCDCADERNCKIYNLLNYQIVANNERLARMSLKEYCDSERNNKTNVI